MSPFGGVICAETAILTLLYCQHLQRIFYSRVCGSSYETQKVHIKIHVIYEMKELVEMRTFARTNDPFT